MHQFLKFILFWNNTLHVSDGLSVHHQEFKTVHTATVMSYRYCYLLASKQVAVSVWHIPVALCTVLNSWWWTERPSETCSVIPKQNKFEILVHVIGFTIEIYVCLLWPVLLLYVLRKWFGSCSWRWRNNNAETRRSCVTDSTVNYRIVHLLESLTVFFFFCCGAATQRGSWSPHSWCF